MRLESDGRGPQPQKKGRFYTAIMWVLTVFMLLSALTFFPSAASLVMLLFSLLSVPVDRVQSFLASKRLCGSVQMVLLLLLFVLAVVLAPA